MKKIPGHIPGPPPEWVKKYLVPFHMGKKILAPSLGGERYNHLPQESPPPGRKLLDFPKTFLQIKV